MLKMEADDVPLLSPIVPWIVRLRTAVVILSLRVKRSTAGAMNVGGRVGPAVSLRIIPSPLFAGAAETVGAIVEGDVLESTGGTVGIGVSPCPTPLFSGDAELLAVVIKVVVGTKVGDDGSEVFESTGDFDGDTTRVFTELGEKV
jgi:hypothetical protein